MVEHFHTSPEDSSKRLDQFLQQRAPQISRTRLRKIIDIGGVHVDGKRIRKCGFSVKKGQKIEVYQDHGPLEPYRIKPDHILYQDDYIIVINKPPGIETQPTPARYKGTLYEALQHHLQGDSRRSSIEIGMVQRLDRDTSGAIVFSIHKEAHASLTEQVKSHSLGKEYLAFVKGIPAPREGCLHTFLNYDKKTRRMCSVESGGKEAITRYRVEKEWSESALVRVELVTGRTHQIRAHFAEAGYPLLGDSLYGGPVQHEGAEWKRQCLHAWKLEFQHPKNGKKLSFTAPVPGDMAAATYIS